MLTIKAPIEITAKTEYVSDAESFYHRIIGNYSLMETHVDPEDLLHVSATPPEIYVAEGGNMTSLINSDVRNETNINKVRILNNVLNRIVMSANADITYQDRVFITDTLYKLGIRDDRRFMKAFYDMAEETRNTNTLINLYLERGGEVRELIEAMEERVQSVEHTEETLALREKENHLYRDVFERLGTGAVYQIVSNFNRTVDDVSIERNEYSVADQTYMAQHMLLSILRDRSGISDENLVFLHTNIYEEDLEQSDVSIENVRNEMNGAVLMDMLSNIYHTGFDRFYLNENKYYSFEDVFYGASVSTLNRLNRYQGDFSYTMRATESLVNENNTLINSEIEMLSASAEEGEISEEELVNITRQVNELNVANERRRQEYNRIVERVRSIARQETGPTGMDKTRQNGILALTSPDKLMEILEEEDAHERGRERQVLMELARVLPEESAIIYEILNQYQNNPELYIDSKVIRPASEGELIYDIRQVEQEAAIEASENAKRAVEEAVRLHEEYESGAGASVRHTEHTPGEYDPVPTVHRRTETLTEEEVEEQLNAFRQDVNRRLEEEVQTTTVTERHTTTNQIVNNETVNQSLNERQIERMISEGVRAQVSAISNQVFKRLESQMRNEKIRRGY